MNKTFLHLPTLLDEYCQWMETRNYANGSIKNASNYITTFIQWCEQRSIHQADEVTKQLLERYQRVLFQYRKANGQPLSFSGQHVRLCHIQSYFRWACKRNYLRANPAADLELPKVTKRIPRAILNQEEVERILNETDINTPLGIRDRTMLELFYATGIRRKELAQLKLYDIDLERGTLLIREGKGKKDRLLPTGQRALRWINKYIEDARPQILIEPDEHDLFLSNYGTGIKAGTVGYLVREYIKRAGIEKSGSCHLFRHTMATLMLEHGADLRYVQQMLGHASLNTTEIYTHVNIKKLIEIHALTHPGK